MASVISAAMQYATMRWLSLVHFGLPQKFPLVVSFFKVCGQTCQITGFHFATAKKAKYIALALAFMHGGPSAIRPGRACLTNTGKLPRSVTIWRPVGVYS